MNFDKKFIMLVAALQLFAFNPTAHAGQAQPKISDEELLAKLPSGERNRDSAETLRLTIELCNAIKDKFLNNDQKYSRTKQLLEKGAQINAFVHNLETTPLSLALQNSVDESIIALLITEGNIGTVNQTDKYGISPLRHAVRAGNVDNIRLLLNCKELVINRNDSGLIEDLVCARQEVLDLFFNNRDIFGISRKDFIDSFYRRVVKAKDYETFIGRFVEILKKELATQDRASAIKKILHCVALKTECTEAHAIMYNMNWGFRSHENHVLYYVEKAVETTIDAMITEQLDTLLVNEKTSAEEVDTLFLKLASWKMVYNDRSPWKLLGHTLFTRHFEKFDGTITYQHLQALKSIAKHYSGKNPYQNVVASWISKINRNNLSFEITTALDSIYKLITEDYSEGLGSALTEICYTYPKKRLDFKKKFIYSWCNTWHNIYRAQQFIANTFPRTSEEIAQIKVAKIPNTVLGEFILFGYLSQLHKLAPKKITVDLVPTEISETPVKMIVATTEPNGQIGYDCAAHILKFVDIRH